MRRTKTRARRAGCRPAVAAAWLALAAWGAVPAPAAADGADGAPGGTPTRGQLLYETHCIACHTTQMHWRDQRTAKDWVSLLAQVRLWQARALLDWSDADIEAVARHLNDRIYRLPAPQRQAAGPSGSAAPPAE